MARAQEGIQVERLVRQFKDVRAVDGIDLQIEPGEIYGFLGPNGAGKSTTVHMLVTLLPPTSGTARVAGFDVVSQGPQVRGAIGAALQEAALDPFLTGREHVRLAASLHGMRGETRKRRIAELLARVGLSYAADRKVRTYSGGMKRRLDLALALVHDPQILFLDEPTTGLDPQSRSALWEEVGRLAKDEGVTVFLTTQYLEEADVLADRVGIIDKGRIVAEGTPRRPESRDRPADGRGRARAARGTQPARADPRALRRGDRRAARRRRGAGERPRHAGRRHPRTRQRRPARRRDQPPPADARRRLPRQDRPVARGRATGSRRGRLSALAHQVSLIARRSLLRTLRQPGVVIPPLTFPLMLMAVNSNGLRAATHLPGFPTHSFLAFFIPFSFIQGALFASGIAGTDLARDIDTGFLNRLALTPMRGAALFRGQMGGAVGLGAIQAVLYLLIGLLAGVRIESGVTGALLILVLAIMIAVGFGALGLWLALRTGSGEGVQSMFPLLFFFTFISSMNLPRNLIEVDWFRDIATINPVSYMIEALRSLVIEGWNVQALALGFGLTIALILGAMTLAARGLRVRMART